MTLDVIAHFHSPLTSKFGIPRQSGLVECLEGDVVFQPAYRNPGYVRGLEGFDYIWLIWAFSANAHNDVRATVRPPLLGGNEAMGVLATRSPYRPNPIGLSSVRLQGITFDEKHGPVLHVVGADLMDGTPIYDIKPYVEYADAHVGVRNGFVDKREWKSLHVVFGNDTANCFFDDEREVVRSLLSLDPRPQYHDDPQRIYGMPYAGRDIRFRVDGGILTVVDVVEFQE